MPWWLLRAEDVRVIRSWASETLPGSAQRSLLKTLRGILSSTAPNEDNLTPKPPVRDLVRVYRGRVLSRGMAPREARLLLEVCRDANDAPFLRDAAVVSLMLLAGLRRQEVVDLQIGDYDEEDGRLIVRSAKAQMRSVMLMGDCRDDLEAWLAQRGHFSGPLFLRFDSSLARIPAWTEAIGGEPSCWQDAVRRPAVCALHRGTCGPASSGRCSWQEVGTGVRPAVTTRTRTVSRPGRWHRWRLFRPRPRSSRTALFRSQDVRRGMRP
jgi:integrase